MANIIFGISGEGSGHAFRAKEIIDHLKKQGHKIKILSYGRGFENLSQFFKVDKIFGLSFYQKNDSIKYLKTFFKNVNQTPEAVKSVQDVRKIFSEFKPDLVLSDFEPISALVSHMKNIPLISIDNQHVLAKTKVQVPKKYLDDWILAKAVTRLVSPRSNFYFITTFSNEKPNKRNVFMFPPVLRREIFDLKTGECENFILVYSTFASSEFIDKLKNLKENFVIYGFDKNFSDENLTFRKKGHKTFLEDLSRCKAVIANAGFGLISEALYFRKPYFAIPLENHFEQTYNAIKIKELGYGDWCEKIEQEKIDKFTKNILIYEKNLKSYPSEDNSKIFSKLEEIIENYAK